MTVKSESTGSVRLGKVINAIMRDIAQARVNADYFSQKAAERYRTDLPGFTVPRIDISDINMDLKLIVDEVSEVDGEQSDEAIVAVYRLLANFAYDKILPLWPVIQRIRTEDKIEIENNLIELLRNSFSISTEVDNNNKSSILLNKDIVTNITKFFNIQSRKEYAPDKESFSYPIDDTVFLDSADNIFLVNYNSSTTSPITIKSIKPELGDITIDDIEEDRESNRLISRKPAPIYISRNGIDKDEQAAMLFMYGKYKLRGTPSKVGPALSIFSGSESDSPVTTKILSCLNNININDRRNIIAVAPPVINEYKGMLALYAKGDKKLIIIDYMKDVIIAEKDLSQDPPNILSMGFTKEGKCLVLLMWDPSDRYLERKIRMLPMSNIKSVADNDLFAKEYLHRTGYRSATLGFSESGDKTYIIYASSQSNTLIRVPYKNTVTEANSPKTWQKDTKIIPVSNQFVFKLATSPDSSYVAALCFPNTRGWTNLGGIFYVYVYSGDLETEIASYEVTPHPLQSRPASFRIFFLANNDLVITRNQEIYTFPTNFDAPSEVNVSNAVKSFGSDHKVDFGKISKMLVKVNQNELSGAQNEISSLNINFVVKNYKWDKTAEEDEVAGILSEEIQS